MMVFLSQQYSRNVTHDMSCHERRNFRALVGIQKVKSDEEALELMNDTDYGLAFWCFL